MSKKKEVAPKKPRNRKPRITAQEKWVSHVMQQMAKRSKTRLLDDLMAANPPPKSVHTNLGFTNTDEIKEKVIQCLLDELLIEGRQAKYETNVAQEWAFGMLDIDPFSPTSDLDVQLFLDSKAAKTINDPEKPIDGNGRPGVRTAKELDELKRFFTQFVNRLLKDVLRNGQSIRWIFNLVDDWRTKFEEQSHFGFAVPATVSITEPEANVYGKGEEIPYVQLINLLDAAGQGVFGNKFGNVKDADARFGAYLFCVMCFSGITNWRLLQGIAHLSLKKQAVDEPYSSMIFPRSKSVPVDKAYAKTVGVEGFGFYRWIPDPVSAKMLQQLHDGKILPKASKNVYPAYIEPFLATLRQQLAEYESNPKSKFDADLLARAKGALNYFSGRNKLIQGARAMQRRTLPAFLWHYLERDYVTHDLFVRTLKRLDLIELNRDLVQKLAFEGSIEVDDDEAMDAFLIEEALNQNTEQNEPALSFDAPPKSIESNQRIVWVTRCLEILQWYQQSGQTDIEREGCKSQLADVFSGGDFEGALLVKTLTDWMRWMLDADPAVSILTIQREAKILLPIMIGNYGLFGDFVDLDAQERMEEFDMIDSESQLSPADRKVLRSAWDRFHAFLIATKQILPNQFIGRKQEVDAEYLSESEYQLVCFWLYYRGASLDEDALVMRNICLLVLTLSYRMGLRRSEVVLLATAHISLFNKELDMLSVQWWIYRRLKSQSSKRTIPILGLLSERESLWLLLMVSARQKGEWIQDDLLSMSNTELKKRIQYYGSIKLPHPIENRFLFIVDPAINLETSVEAIVRKIHEAIRAVTAQEKQLRFHHLRHSCATNSMMLLFANRLPHSQRFLIDLMYSNVRVNERIHRMATEGLRIKDCFNPEVQMEDFQERSKRIRQYLLNDSRASISETYVVSRLLGHSSPITTLKSYAHIVDLLLGAFNHERFIRLPNSLRSVLHPYVPQYLDELIEKTKINYAELPMTLLEIKSTGKASAKEEQVLLIDVVERSKSEGLLMILELLQTYFWNQEGDQTRYFKKAAIAGLSKPLAEQLIVNFNQVIEIFNSAKKDRTTRILPEGFEGDDMAMFKTPQLKEQAIEWTKVLIEWYKKRPSKAYPLLMHYVSMASRSKPNVIRMDSVDADTDNQNKSKFDKGSVESKNPSAELRRNRRNYTELMDTLGIRYQVVGNAIRSKGNEKKDDNKSMDQNGVWALLRKLLFLIAITMSINEI